MNNILPDSQKKINLNVYELMEKNNIWLVLGYRWILFSLVSGLLTLLISTRIGLPTEINKFIPADNSIRSFFTIVSTVTSLFVPIMLIAVFALCLKLINAIFIFFYKVKITMKQAFIISTFSYSFLFISQIVRSIVSLKQGIYFMHSVLSFGFYVPSLVNKGFLFRLLENFDLFSLIFIYFMAKGLGSYTKTNIKVSLIIMFCFYMGLNIFQSLVLR
ncbi:MAG: hypothetical protein ABF868_11775 [Sporolactobacillus sp.]